MPRCINDKSKSYTGNEPSPKGFGYCAHAEKLYSVRNGTDGYQYVVIKTKACVKRWVKLSIPSRIIAKFKNINTHVKLTKTKWWNKQFIINNKEENNKGFPGKVMIKKITKGKNNNDIIVHHDGPWNVYNDPNFTKTIRKITKYPFTFSEQGLQKNKQAHMEISSNNILKMLKVLHVG